MEYLECKPGRKVYYVETCRIEDKELIIELVREAGHGNSSRYKHNGEWFHYTLFRLREEGDDEYYSHIHEHFPYTNPGSIEVLDNDLKEVMRRIRKNRLENITNNFGG